MSKTVLNFDHLKILICFEFRASYFGFLAQRAGEFGFPAQRADASG